MTETLLYALGVLLMAAGIALSIGLHEVGHMLPAKRFGVYVGKFMIGFGPTLFSRKIGETEYGFKLLPLGGFVQLAGMYPPNARRAPSRDQQDSEQQESAQQDFADEDSVSHKRPVLDERGVLLAAPERSFYNLKTWQKITVMLGGPLVNLLLGCVLLTVLLSGIGVPQPTVRVASVVECLQPASSVRTHCQDTDRRAPAAAAGVLPQDKIVSVAGKPVADWHEVRRLFGANPGAPIEVVVERAGMQQRLQLTPELTERVKTDAFGNPLRDGNGGFVYEQAGLVGLTPVYERTRLPITAVPAQVWEHTKAAGVMLANLPNRLVAVWQAAFSSAERDPNGPLSVVGVGRLAGEITSAEQISLVDKAATLVGLLAGLNIVLFVFNLIPLLPLDGGHVAGALYEGAKRRLYKLLGKPDPGPVDVSKMLPLTVAVVVIFGAMSLLLIYADIVKPITFGL